MKKILLLAILTVSSMVAWAGYYPVSEDAKEVSHQGFDEVLNKFVDEDGNVRYKALKRNSETLRAYTKMIRSSMINPNWSKNEKIAFWINAYNAHTLEMIIDHYPIKKISDIETDAKSVWDDKFIQMGEHRLSLNDIEHKILRAELHEKRVHFAVNCSAVSCPALLNMAYTADNLNKMLNKQTKLFFLDSTKNHYDGTTLSLSKILDWYKVDFGGTDADLLEFINKYTDAGLPEGTEIKYLPYNWILNDTKNL